MAHPILSEPPFPPLSMEQFLKALSLASPDNHPAAVSAPPPAATTGVLTLQQFLASPFNTPSPSSTTTHSSNGLISFYACPQKKRNPPGEDGNATDRKKNRLMKNRESAARSRAKKQAYTYELELEVAHLMKENSRLKKQQEQLSAAAVDGDRQKKKKHRLDRSLSAPF